MIGVYAFMFDRQVKPAYIGVTTNINKRIMQHKGREYFCCKVIYQTFDDIEDAKMHEQYLIARYKPPYNRKEYRLPQMFEVDSIEDVFCKNVHRPWSQMSMLDAIEIEQRRAL